MSYWIKTEEGKLINLSEATEIAIRGKEKKGKKNVSVEVDIHTIKNCETKQEAEKIMETLFDNLCPISPNDELNFEEKKK